MQMVVFAYLSVIGQCPYAFGQSVVVGEHGSAVSEASERFRREERRTSDVSRRAGVFTCAVRKKTLRAERLCVVLYHRQSVSCRHVVNSRHVARLSEQVHRYDGFRAWCYHAFGTVGRHVERVSLHVGEYGCAAEQGHGFRHGTERECRHYHLVALSDAGRHHRDE